MTTALKQGITVAACVLVLASFAQAEDPPAAGAPAGGAEMKAEAPPESGVAAPGPAKPGTTVKRDLHHGPHGKPGPHGGVGAPGPGKGGAGGGPGGPSAMPYPGGMIERHAKRLGVDDATVAKMREKVEVTRKENEKLRKKVEAEQRSLQTLLEQDLPEEKAVMAQVDKIGTMMIAQRKNQLRTVLEIRGMLTPEQRAELAKIRAGK